MIHINIHKVNPILRRKKLTEYRNQLKASLLSPAVSSVIKKNLKNKLRSLGKEKDYKSEVTSVIPVDL